MKSSELDQLLQQQIENELRRTLLERAKPYVEDYINKIQWELQGSDAFIDKPFAKWLRAEKRKAKQLLKDMG